MLDWLRESLASGPKVPPGEPWYSAWPKLEEIGAGKLALRPEALAMLTDGIDLRGAKMRPWFERG